MAYNKKEPMNKIKIDDILFSGNREYNTASINGSIQIFTILSIGFSIKIKKFFINNLLININIERFFNKFFKFSELYI